MENNVQQLHGVLGNILQFLPQVSCGSKDTQSRAVGVSGWALSSLCSLCLLCFVASARQNISALIRSLCAPVFEMSEQSQKLSLVRQNELVISNEG